MFSDGKVPICKQCIKDDLDETDVNSVKKVLRQIDKPFIAIEWQKCLNSGKEPFGWYLRQISALHQYKDLTYDDSVDGEVDTLNYKNTNDLDISDDDIYEKATPDVKRKWGTGYSDKEYYELEQTWKDMITSNDINTPQHKKNLKLYCKLAVRVERALEDGDIKTFEMLNKQFSELQKNSGFRPIDKRSGSESAGIRSFSAIWEEVESDGFIEPWDLEFSQDVIDKTIIYMSNYTRKILDLGQIISVPADAPKIGDE